MNRIDTNINGGFPVTLNDLRFIDDAIRLALDDILKGLAGDQPVIIFGCTVSPLEQGDYQVSAGAVFYQGEIWHVYQHLLSYSQIPDWAFYLTYDPTGNKTFKDGIQHNTYEIRKAILCDSASHPGGTVYSIAADQVKFIKDVFLGDSVAVPTLEANTTILSGSTLKVAKSNKRAILQGQIRNSYISAFAHALTLPLSYRPVTAVSGFIPGKITGTSDYIMLRFKVDTDGKFWLYYDSTVSADMDLAIHYLTV